MVHPMTEPTPTPDNASTYAPWEQFRRPYVRDLAYVLACPNVLTKWLNLAPPQNTAAITVHSASFWQAQFDSYLTRLQELDTTLDYQQLTRYLLTRPSPNRLGFHFEGLLSFWLTDGYAHGLHPYEIIASNVQLYQGKQTIGELDLVLYNHHQKLTEHWELAIKFFMGSAPFAPENWVGINSNDNLQRKMVHMQTKQFCTLWIDTEDHGRVKIDKRYAVIKGRFFLPINHNDFVYPDWLAISFPMHRWYDRQDTANLAALDLATLRPAHYVEWFTKRDFYDDPQQPLLWSQSELPMSGLYFDHDKPLVIYPEQEVLVEAKR